MEEFNQAFVEFVSSPKKEQMEMEVKLEEFSEREIDAIYKEKARAMKALLK